MNVSNKPINERLITFSGKASLGQDLADDVCFKVRGGVINEEYLDNQDGTCDKIFRVKIISVEPCVE